MSVTKQPVSVVAPARLHMGFIDMNGSLGRRFGSLGIALNEIETRLTLKSADTPHANGPNAERALRYLNKFTRALDVPNHLHIEIQTAIPEHVGLGSGTQMSLAIGRAVSQFYGLKLSIRDLARTGGRGARSGIGVGVFEKGGFIIDGGHSDETEIPPIISRMDFPSDWRILLVFDSRGNGLHGKNEVEAFERLPPFPKEEVARFCHLLMMRALPGLAERNLRGFGDAITEIQESIGEYFASAQGGRFTSPDVSAAVRWMGEQGAVGLGQSSWGPTGFCLIEEENAAALLEAAETRFKALPMLQFRMVSARNQGGRISVAGPDFSVSLPSVDSFPEIMQSDN